MRIASLGLGMIALSAGSAAGQCSPSTLTVSGSYTVNGQLSPPLKLVEGQSYTFNCATVSSLHPFILTTSSVGGFANNQFELTSTQVPGYVMGGHCNGCGRTTFTITPSAATPDLFYYQCNVHQNLGDRIDIIRPVSISEHPQAQTSCGGNAANFSVSASAGSATVTYQWRKGGQNLSDEPNHIAGANSSTLMIVNTAAGDAGNYDCVVTNVCVSATSDAAALAVNESCCDSIDFNNDEVFPDTQDLFDYLNVFAGGACSNDPNCNDIDFNNDEVFPDIADLEKFLEVFAGGIC